MARCRSARDRTSPQRLAVATVLLLGFAAAPAQGAPAVWQHSVTLGNGSTYIGRGQGAAVPSAPLIVGQNAGLPGTTTQQAGECHANALDPAKVTGKIVQCDNGGVPLATKSTAIQNAGGIAMVVTNTSPGELSSDALSLPTVHADHVIGAAIKAYTAGTASPTASMNAAQRIFAASTTTLASSANPSTLGRSVTVTATVGAGSLQPEGSVAFKSLGVAIPGCGSVAVAAGKATCTFSPLVVGAYSVEGAYSGDDGLNPSAGTLVQQVNAAQTSPPPPSEPPAISDLRLRSNCVRRPRSGRVRVAMTMQLAEPSAVQVLVERGVGSKGRRRCVSQGGARPTVFRPVTTVHRDAAAAAGERRLRLRLRLRPGLYRLTVRAVLADESLSRPVRAFVRVLK